MFKAFILLNSETGSEKAVIDEIKNIRTIIHVYRVFGVYDIILYIEENDLGSIEQVITGQIRKIKTVRSTLTLHVSN